MSSREITELSNQVRPPESWVDQNVAWHYGDPLREQKNLVNGLGVVDLSNRGIIRISGDDRKKFLHSITSHHIERLNDGQSETTLLLSQTGHIEHELHVIEKDQSLWLIVEESSKQAALDFLNKMIFMSRVEITDENKEFAVVFEPKRETDTNYPTWLTPENYTGTPIKNAGQSAGGDPNRYVPVRPGIFLGRELIINKTDLLDYLTKNGPVAGTWALEALRIAAGVPRVIIDIDHKTIPHEVGLIGTAVHLEKGCYKGQETIARVHNLGKPPRKLVLLHLDGSPNRLPNKGSAVVVDGDEVGLVGSSAQHYELGPIALALIKAKTKVLLNVAVDEIPATIQDIVVGQ